MTVHAHSNPAPTIGIIGGGQLARMTAQAAFQFGCEVVILERKEASPAAKQTHRTLIGDWDDPASLLKLAALVDVVTLENEFVDANALAELEKHGHALWPTAACIRVVQDKLWQKQNLVEAGLPLPRFLDTPTPAALEAAAKEFGFPLVLKKRRNGYDGKGNATVKTALDLDHAWHVLEGQKNALFAEAWCPVVKELAVMVTRSLDGREVSYPVVETVQHDHICHIVKAPAPVSAEVAQRAADIARRAVAAVGGVGSFGVEMFLLADGALVINELAPRVHNSGHYTIEACVCSQFENHVRAVLGWPLGSTAMLGPAAVMINLLGAGGGSGKPHGLEKALKVPGAHPHIYGKAASAKGRKMGHLTALGATVEEALATAQRAAAEIRFGD
jgi:5-(carboxyamino)imidazole ribonucleotide synthase